MRNLIHTWWHDDDGAIIAAEFLFIATILIIGIVVGFANVRDAINTEFSELANGFLALSQGFLISGQSGCCAASDGTQAIDTPSLVPEIICTPPAIPSIVDSLPCG